MLQFLQDLIQAILDLFRGKKENTDSESRQEERDNEGSKKQKNDKASIANSYQAKYLLTRNEWYEWKKLQEYAEAKGLRVCPKVRLLDIVEPRPGSQNYKSLMARIQSKHVDFVICDQSLRIKAILELDDNSHNRSDRQERDNFVDSVLTNVGYKVIRTRSITEHTLDGL